MPRRTDEYDPLPVWKEFRARYASESHADYKLALLEDGLVQARGRDHWLSNQLAAVLGQTELLRRDLVGDGTALRHGALNQIQDQLRILATEQKRTPEIIARAIKEARTNHDAQEWTTAKKWLWGTVAMTIAAVLGSLTYMLAIHGH